MTIDPMLIGRGGWPSPVVIYLNWDRLSALADWYLRVQGQLEPLDCSAAMTCDERCLPADRHWPARIVLERNRPTAS